MADYKRADGSKRICRCECGGWVRGIEDFGRLWTWCTKCTPVERITLDPRHPEASVTRRSGGFDVKDLYQVLERHEAGPRMSAADDRDRDCDREAIAGAQLQ